MEVPMPELSLQKKAKRLRIYISEKDRWRGNSLDVALMELLRENGIAGATEFRGIAGFGAHSLIHTIRIEVLMSDLPIVIETIDTEEKITNILDLIYPMVREGLITVDEIEIVKYTHRYLNPLPADKLVSEVMTQNVVSLRPEMAVQQAWDQMLKNKVKATPVIDSAGRVVGILTDEDLLERAGIQQRLSVALRMDADEVTQDLRLLESSPLTVNDVMTQPVITALENESLGVATSRMVKSGLKRLPVVDNEGKLVGVLSRLDILRQVANITYETPVPQFPSKAVRTVSDIMSSEIPMVNQDDDLSLIIEKFSKSDSHRLIVVDSDGKAIGLLSDSDVVMRVQPAKRRSILDAFRNIGKPAIGKETAFDLMSPGLLTASPDTSATDALKRMLAESRKWMVVVDEKDHPLGLVDRQMMLEAIAVFDIRD
jgi:CBS domain-containing protein/PII-like signaling protein